MIATSEGAELYFTARGQGPVCLVPCSLGTAPYERQLPAALDQHLTLVFVDLRGSGRSTGNAADLTFDRLATDLEAVRDQLGVDQVAVLGHSVLGALAIEYARRCPDRVSRAIAVGTPPTGDMAALMASAQAFFAEDASPERKRLLAENLAALPPGNTDLAAAIYAQTPMRFHDPRFDPRPLFEGAITRPEILGHLLGTLISGWDVTAGPPLQVPLLLALGRHDYVVPWHLWEPALPALPTARRHLFERSGHQPFVEEPDQFVATVVGTLESP